MGSAFHPNSQLRKLLIPLLATLQFAKITVLSQLLSQKFFKMEITASKFVLKFQSVFLLQ